MKSGKFVGRGCGTGFGEESAIIYPFSNSTPLDIFGPGRRDGECVVAWRWEGAYGGIGPHTYCQSVYELGEGAPNESL